jgi:hypothetical protein
MTPAEILPFPAGRYSDQIDAFSQALHRAFTARRSECMVGIIGVGGVIDWSYGERAGCVCRKLDPAILVMKATKNGAGCDCADALNSPMDRAILV